MRSLTFSLVVLMALSSSLIHLISPASVCANLTLYEDLADSGEWAVILSPGPQEGVPWGGYHVTITGYSKTNACSRSEQFLSHNFRAVFSGQPWHLHGKLPNLKRWSQTDPKTKTKTYWWTQTFDSDVLDQLADQLKNEGFDAVKGPKYTDTQWHITLLQTDAEGVRNKAVSDKIIDKFTNKEGPVDWYLWLLPKSNEQCQKYGTQCPDWGQPIEATPTLSERCDELESAMD
jgi:hypothetical protein